MLHIWVTVALVSVCVSSGKEMERSQQRKEPVMWEAQPLVPPAVLSIPVGHEICRRWTGYKDPPKFAFLVHFNYLAI